MAIVIVLVWEAKPPTPEHNMTNIIDIADLNIPTAGDDLAEMMNDAIAAIGWHNTTAEIDWDDTNMAKIDIISAAGDGYINTMISAGINFNGGAFVKVLHGSPAEFVALVAGVVAEFNA